jgi:hypothetical protein
LLCGYCVSGWIVRCVVCGYYRHGCVVVSKMAKRRGSAGWAAWHTTSREFNVLLTYKYTPLRRTEMKTHCVKQRTIFCMKYPQ